MKPTSSVRNKLEILTRVRREITAEEHGDKQLYDELFIVSSAVFCGNLRELGVEKENSYLFNLKNQQ